MKSRFEKDTYMRPASAPCVMSYSNNLTVELWRSFMPRRKEIQNNIGTDLFSLQYYAPSFFDNFNPDSPFEKFAAVEVEDFDTIPEGMDTHTIPGGLYAVFLYRGSPSTASETYRHIFGTWLRNSEYALDDRPHFEVLGENYNQNDPDSEEEIWIPVKLKDKNH